MVELDDRYFEILAQTRTVMLSRHRFSGEFDIWINNEWSRMFVDPNNGFRSEPTEQQAWEAYMKAMQEYD